MALMKDTKNSMITGVCAGIAKATGVDVTIVRLLTVLSFLISGSLTFWIYVLLAILLPTEQ